MKGDIYINTFLVPDRNLVFRPGWIDFEKMERTVNNTLVSDFIGFKRTFSFEYTSWMDGEFVEYLIGLYEEKEDLTLYVHDKDDVAVPYICKLSISQEYVREYKIDNFAYSGFSFSMEEV